MKFLIFVFFLISFNLAIAQENKIIKKESFIDLTNQSVLIDKIDKKNDDANINSEKNNKQKILKSIKIGKLESPSLGSIGKKTNLNRIFGLNLWSDISTKKAIKYLNYLPNRSSSIVYQNILNDIYASTSEPPKGNTEEIKEFVKIKLLKLSMNGQVESLLKIVEQLPDGAIWGKWKKWYIIYKLLNKEDDNTCKKIFISKKKYNDVFWEKANLVCFMLKGDYLDANFIFDVMSAQNLLDGNFKILADHVINEKSIENLKINNDIIKPLDLVLLDILKYPINVKMVENLGNEYNSVLLNLIYTEPETRVFLIDRISKFKDLDRNIIVQAFQSIKDKGYSEEELLSLLTKQSDGQIRAQAWLFSQKIKDNATKAKFIFKILEIEEKNRNLSFSVNLYLPVLMNLEKKTLSQSQSKVINYINILKYPEKFPKNKLSQIIKINKNVIFDYKTINNHKAWNLFSYLKFEGMRSPEILWEKEFDDFPKKNIFIDKTWSRDVTLDEFILERSIEDDISNNKKLSALLKIGSLIGKKDLKYLNLNSFFVIDKALGNLEFKDMRLKFRNEIFFHKFFNLRVFSG